jgi:hypothetical protein
MKKRLCFKCWNCGKEYTLFKPVAGGQVMIVACPFCNLEGVVNLEPYKKKKVQLMRSLASPVQAVGTGDQPAEMVFPEVIPTQEKD